MHKWRKDTLKMKHFDLLKLVLDESGYSSMLKNKKDLENENRLENLKELLEPCKIMTIYKAFRTCGFGYIYRSGMGGSKNKFDDHACC